MSLKDQAFTAETHTDAPLATRTLSHTQMGESLIYPSKLGTMEKCAGQKELVITSEKSNWKKQEARERSQTNLEVFSVNTDIRKRPLQMYLKWQVNLLSDYAFHKRPPF